VSGLAGAHGCPVCGEPHTGRRIKPPKSEAGARWVPLVGGTVRELLAHQAAQSTLREQWGSDYNDHHLVFCQEDGTPIRPDWLSKRFDVLVDAAGLPRIRLHDTRHGAASLLIAAGVPVEVVALVLGHADTAVTRGYMHVLRGAASAGMRDAVELVRPGHGAQSVHSPGESAADDAGSH
jgi:integrase